MAQPQAASPRRCFAQAIRARSPAVRRARRRRSLPPRRAGNTSRYPRPAEGQSRGERAGDAMRHSSAPRAGIGFRQFVQRLSQRLTGARGVRHLQEQPFLILARQPAHAVLPCYHSGPKTRRISAGEVTPALTASRAACRSGAMPSSSATASSGSPADCPMIWSRTLRPVARHSTITVRPA